MHIPSLDLIRLVLLELSRPKEMGNKQNKKQPDRLQRWTKINKTRDTKVSKWWTSDHCKVSIVFMKFTKVY